MAIFKYGFDQPLSATQTRVSARVERLLGHASMTQRVKVIGAWSLRAELDVKVRLSAHLQAVQD